MNSTLSRFWFCLALTLLSCPSATAGDVVVISNSEITVSPDEVADIYTGEKQFSGSTQLIPVDNAALQEGFLSAFMQMDTVKYNRLWTRKLFRDGLARPSMKSGDVAVSAYVRRTPGAIGYVSTIPPGVKVIQIISVQ
ncbi:MAG: hypothetical protein A2V79_06720 [Betaproteobacteria bacterium RBG_16_56_24]|nr:MAG: hypothetical protein A2V79_06720 [Betaproteobacteria bacterium RBG_16_56_24]